MRRTLFAVLPFAVAACQGAGSLASPIGGAQSSLTSVRASLPSIAGQARAKPARAVFSTPQVVEAAHKPAWVFASNGEGGNVDVYDQKTFKMISGCPCDGVGLAVQPKTGVLAVGARSSSITLWRVARTGITQFGTLKLSQGPYAIGIAFDGRGNLYAGNAGDNVIDFFTADEVKNGTGSPARTLFTTNLNEVEYLAATGTSLVADGYNQNGQPIIVSVNTKTGADTILQMPVSGTLPYGIVFDRKQNLIFNNAGNTNTIFVYAKPWNGSPSVSFVYGNGASNGYYSGISLNAAQTTLWAANFTILNPSHAAVSVQANSYPLGSVGNGSLAIAGEFYDSIAAWPQGK
jgi:hypothetical protein